MGFFNNIESENVAARITNRGRQKIAEGNFIISYFQIGDSEFDYEFPEFSGNDLLTNPPQKVFIPLDKDDIVKYPYKLSESTLTGTTYGIPIRSIEATTLTNNMGAAGFVSGYATTGSTIGCEYIEIDISTITGSTELTIPTTSTTIFGGCEFITLAFTELSGLDPNNPLFTTSSNSLIYKVLSRTTGLTSMILELDRNTPDLSAFTGNATIISNKCDPFWGEDVPYQVDCSPIVQQPEDRQDPWTLNIVWSQKPAGMDTPTSVDEHLSGYTGNAFVSTKEFLGYNSLLGQMDNTTTTITNAFGDIIEVPPTEQHSLAIIHYAELNSQREPEKYFKYEDYIAHTEEDDIQYFEVYIPYLLYHRNTGTTVGARFVMDSGETSDHYINSNAEDTKLNKIKFKYLKDEFGNNVGKIFVNHKIIVFDDQEIVAALDYKSNRRYTLPIPRTAQIPIDLKCVDGEIVTEPLMAGTTGETVYISYLFEMTGNTGMTGLHCNYYSKVTGTTFNADVTVSFSPSQFIHLKNDLESYKIGFIANKFYILAQKVVTGELPTPDGWKIMDYTDHIQNHTVGNNINPTNIGQSRFVVSYNDYENASFYDIEDYLGSLPDEPSSLPQFGDTQPFAGSVKLVRATDIYTMRFFINLPSGQFETTQNPTYTSGDKRVTEIALLNDNRDVMVIGKIPKPIIRSGTQVIAVKLDL